MAAAFWPWVDVMPLATGNDEMDAARLKSLEAWLCEALEAKAVRIEQARLLAGGAIQENLSFVVDIDGGERAGHHQWVLRTDAAARLTVSLDRAAEFAVLRAAYAAGVAVAEPIARCSDVGVIGAPFLIQAFMPGVAQARRIVRDEDLPKFGEGLTERLGTELARIHAIVPPRDD